MSDVLFDAEPILRGLKGFQRKTVDHVVGQLFDPGLAGRFLVADETGLGKSLVARGVIARVVERLQHEPDVKRVDIVYVCSNHDLAQQNIGRLSVLPDDLVTFDTRLTLLAKHSRSLASRAGRPTANGKVVNLVSFTPGTSFDTGNRAGMKQERALLFVVLSRLIELSGWDRRAALRLLQGGVRTLEAFERAVQETEGEVAGAGLEPRILEAFGQLTRANGHLDQFRELVDALGRKRAVPPELRDNVTHLIGQLRGDLARAGVQTLEPDLVIVDEFQRFRDLLDPTTPAGELAHHLFDYEAARVLLLSATPYKPFTYGEEREECHERDFLATLGFCAGGSLEQLQAGLRDYRAALVGGHDVEELRQGLRTQLLRVMSRCERPVVDGRSMLTECRRPATGITPEDLVGFVRLQQLAGGVAQPRDRGLAPAEYWKSAPYFVTFCDGYQLRERIRASVADPATRTLLHHTQHLSADQVTAFEAVDAGNARLRELVSATLDQGWWQLLWMPPSLPYLRPGGPFAAVAEGSMTKRLVFSSWAATPTAVASLLSYEAERRISQGTNYTEYTAVARRRLAQPLTLANRDGEPASMSALLLVWPIPRLAQLADPRRAAADSGGMPVDGPQWLAAVADSLRQQDGGHQPGAPAGTSIWRAAFGDLRNWPDVTELGGRPDPQLDAQRLAVSLQFALSGDAAPGADDHDTADAFDDDPDGSTALGDHVAAALAARGTAHRLDGAGIQLLARVAAFGLGNLAYRVLARLRRPVDSTTELGRIVAAGRLAIGLRALFNRPDVTKLVEKVVGGDDPYWVQVLRYVEIGNLEAALDEWLFHRRAESLAAWDDLGIQAFALKASEAVSLRTVTLRAFDASNPDEEITFVPRFALRYGRRRGSQISEDARLPEVREAFNSPFWPFVLVSTSVGQEGIDFHWWCHAVFHWNTPPNPVDFEQREGRVDRYRGHAIRKNVAARHGARALADGGENPWSSIYDLATEHRSTFGDLSPDWVYPGPARIERHICPMVLSSDGPRYERTVRDVALYRLTFGQPRQEDLLTLLHHRFAGQPPDVASLRIDLNPGNDGGGLGDGGGRPACEE